MTAKTVHAGVLQIAYQEVGPADAPPVILLHGFPYAPDSFAGLAGLALSYALPARLWSDPFLER